MINKNIVIGLVIALVALAGTGVYFYNQQIFSNTTVSGTKGHIVFGIKDAAANMGNISSVIVTVNNVQVHSQTEGWVTLSSQTKQYDLLALKQSGKIEVLADTNVAAGTYDQIRLQITKIVVVENGTQKEAKLPSGDLKIMGDVVVKENATATAVFDFMTDESLHLTGQGKFIFTPVVNLETRSDADANVNSQNEVDITGGNTRTKVNVGMDVTGEVREDFKVEQSTKLDLINNVIKVTVQNESENAVKVSSDDAIKAAVNGGYLDTVISVALTTENSKKEWVVSGLKSIMLTNVYISAETGAYIKSK